ncbi:hypothetical protein PAXINDRAFT_157718 [Paxillus involutus ATCC 200175]|uniref:Uncharacterized protein n=1 Tax=Paxillus involutus ATCC 200175 TaxID=664439 RepID=A0A0C9TQM5_PAXIN|nr:hypothetical protein PAXINDRAFT_157718 [Paxillus involutus ATCC 200175]
MGCPKLYHTADDKRCAVQSYRKTYYLKNRKRISERNKEKYRKRKCLDGEGTPDHGEPTYTAAQTIPTHDHDDLYQDSMCEHVNSVKGVEVMLMTLLNNSLTSFVDTFICRFVQVPSPLDAMERVLNKAEGIHRCSMMLHAKVLQEKGVGYIAVVNFTINVIPISSHTQASAM